MAHFASKSGPQMNDPIFLLGQNRHGQWIVRELHGKIGASSFVDRNEAIRFARDHSGSGKPSIIPINGPLDTEGLQ